MNGDTRGVYWCSCCALVRELGDLLRVTDRHGRGAAFYICRPSVQPSCFSRSVGLADRWAITLATGPVRYRSSRTDAQEGKSA